MLQEQHPQDRELEYYRNKSEVKEFVNQYPLHQYDCYVTNSEKLSSLVQEELPYRLRMLHQFRKPLAITISVFVILVALACFLFENSIQNAQAQQLKQMQQNNKVCGIQHTHDGTPIVLHYQTDTTFQLNGNVNTQTNCGY